MSAAKSSGKDKDILINEREKEREKKGQSSYEPIFGSSHYGAGNLTTSSYCMVSNDYWSLSKFLWIYPNHMLRM